MENVNLWAVLAATASSFLLGGVWYSKGLFGAAWHREAGMAGREVSADAQAKGKHPAGVFAISIALALVAAFLFARMLPPNSDLLACARTGLKVGVGFVAASFGINYAFASRSLKLWLIDAGYHVVQFLLYGVILGAWR